MKKYFLSANTAEGYISFFDEAKKQLSLVYTLSGHGCRSSDIIKKAAYDYNADELILNPADVNSACGCIWTDKNTGLFCDGAGAPPDLTEEYKGLYKAYAEAKKLHDDWEKIYISNMNVSLLNQYSGNVITKILGNNRRDKEPINKNRFFGASTPDGSVNFIDELTEDIETRYFIKGRPGTGKSTFLKRLGSEARQKGFDTETYYCSFDPKSLDMIVIRELSLCVFDSTAPHEKFPESDRDVILDFYSEAGLTGVDEKYEKELAEISTAYNDKVKEGREYLSRV